MTFLVEFKLPKEVQQPLSLVVPRQKHKFCFIRFKFG